MTDEDLHRTAEHSCPHCGYVTNMAGRPTGTGQRPGAPRHGDASVCLACAGVSVFVAVFGGGALRLRLPTAHEQAVIMGNMRVQLAVASVAAEKARHHARGERWAGDPE